MNPGPGQYDAGGHKTLRPTSSYGKIGTTKRQDLWGADKQARDGQPGPGHHHTKSLSSFDQTKGGGFGLTSARKDIKNSNPGPGHYSEMGKTLTQTKSTAARIGSAKRAELWQKETKGEVPGPGNYADETNTFGKAAKGVANMGSKYKAETNLNPGPGQYDADPNKNKRQAPNTKVSQAQRQDLWADQSRQDLPGPGNYAVEASSFKDSRGGANNMGSKYKPEVNMNPGPGQYDADASKILNRTQGSVRIG